ncbi:arginase family protein [Mycolicibacterium sp. XJ870]
MQNLTRRARGWWLHIDLDVLDPVEFAAQGLPDVPDEPGGLTWNQLTDLVLSMRDAAARCVGCSIAIYDPEQDPSLADAGRVVEYAGTVLGP